MGDARLLLHVLRRCPQHSDLGDEVTLKTFALEAADERRDENVSAFRFFLSSFCFIFFILTFWMVKGTSQNGLRCTGCGLLRPSPTLAQSYLGQSYLGQAYLGQKVFQAYLGQANAAQALCCGVLWCVCCVCVFGVCGLCASKKHFNLNI